VLKSGDFEVWREGLRGVEKCRKVLKSAVDTGYAYKK
jgi:hypothetical protein